MNGGDIHADDDGDGIPNCVEQGGVDLDGDGNMDFTTNSSPTHKDVFVKIDWRTSYPPNWTAVDDVVAAFAAAPVTNLDGVDGVTLHYEKGEALPDQTLCDCGCLATLVDTDRMLLSATQRSQSNANLIFKGKVKFVHYFQWGDTSNDKNPGSSGVSCGNGYTAISLGSQWAGGNQAEHSGTFMHELGHQIGLGHGGNEARNYKPNYLSIMNYAYQTTWPATLGVLGYSRGMQPTLDEQNLNEADGIGANSAVTIRFFTPLDEHVGAAAAGAINWNKNASSADVGVTADINGDRWCLLPGANNVLDSRKSGDDIYYGDSAAFVERTSAPGTPIVTSGDDVGVLTATGAKIYTGPNRILETALNAGDILHGLQIHDGANRTCESDLVGDDVNDQPGSVPQRTKNSVQAVSLADNNDWGSINYANLFNLKGGFGLDIPPSSVDNPPPSMTRKESEALQLADLSVTATTTFNPKSRVARYDVTIANAGPKDVLSGNAIVKLPITAQNIACSSSSAGFLCSSATNVDGSLVRADLPPIGVGGTITFTVTTTVDSSHCSEPDRYTVKVTAEAYERVDPNMLNNSVTVAFADLDKNGAIDVCSWPTTAMTVYGTHSIYIGDRAKILDNGTPSAFGMVVHGGSGAEHRLGANAHSGDTLSGGSPFLANNATVHGDLTCVNMATLQDGALITGNRKEMQPLPSALARLDIDVTWAPYVKTEVIVQNSASQPLEPASYGKVVVNGGSHLYLSAGDYQFNELQFESGAKIHLDTSKGVIRLFVRSNLAQRGTWITTDPTGASTLLAYLGANGVTFDTNVAATVIVPNASLEIGAGSQLDFSGAFFARDLTVRPDVKVQHVAFSGLIPFRR